MADRAPEPSSGKRVEGPGGYQMNAGCAGGSSRIPVLFGESFTGCAGSNVSPDSFVSKLYLTYGRLFPTKYGQPKFPAAFATLNSSNPGGPRLGSACKASGPTSPQNNQPFF